MTTTAQDVTAHNTTTPAIGHNGAPAYLEVFQEIDDLYEEAKNFADGEPITSEEMHDAVTKLYDGLHDAGKRADELRKEEKKPLDDAVKAIQDRYNVYVQPKKGRVDMGKAALGDLLAKWRAAVQAKKAAEAEAARIEADRLAEEAQAAIRASSSNLAAREEAEMLLAEAKDVGKWAKRTEKAATTGTGLRTVWVATLIDADAGLDWAYGKSPDRFVALVQQMADEAVRLGARSVPGFVVDETKRAA